MIMDAASRARVLTATMMLAFGLMLRELNSTEFADPDEVDLDKPDYVHNSPISVTQLDWIQECLTQVQ